MGKIVILTSDCQTTIDMVIRITNWNKDVADVIDVATRHWKESDLEFREVIEDNLEKAGYKFEIIDDYVVIDDPAG